MVENPSSKRSDLYYCLKRGFPNKALNEKQKAFCPSVRVLLLFPPIH